MESEKSGFTNEMSEIWRKMQIKNTTRFFSRNLETSLFGIEAKHIKVEMLTGPPLYSIVLMLTFCPLPLEKASMLQVVSLNEIMEMF